MPAPGEAKRFIAQCTICGKRMSRAGLIGHMAWKHGKDRRAPLLPSKAMARSEEHRKARLYDALISGTATLDERVRLHAVMHRGDADAMRSGICPCGGKVQKHPFSAHPDGSWLWACDRCGDVKHIELSGRQAWQP